ncbi:hypothetical protein Cgig2_013910 [Carnegiea gigantea]|uniref:Uncharacterized protein n=1 Tax=Carnegiea gigantea TaxID=171969 RepID=A0A9Q1JWQ9_9CARY|nr:hypothetical protein Cgig2_013910 [Carnegiea gigantea]
MEATHVSSSRSDSDDDISEYKAKDEGKDNAKSSSSVMGEDEVSGSSRGCAMPELRSKKRHDKGCVGDVGVSGKPAGKVSRKSRYSDVQQAKAGGEAMVDAVIRHRCALEAVCSLNTELEEVQKSNVEAPRPFGMGKHLVRALVEGWNVETKAFKVGSREIPFSVYDVALLTGLPAIGKQVTFDRGIGASEVEEVIKAAMEDHLAKERNRRRSARSDVRLYRNYVPVMMELYKQKNNPESLALFRKLYSL